MLSAALPVLFALCPTPLAGPAPRQQPAPTGVARPLRVPCDYASGWPQVEVLLNGEGPFTMIVDTGNTVGGVLLNGDLVRELGLEVVGETRAGDPTDPRAVRLDLVEVDSLALGDATFTHVRGAAWERPPGLVREGVRGILGLPLFAGCLLTFDARAGTLELRRGEVPEPGEPGVLAYRTDGEFGGVTFEMDVEGLGVETHLDTGNARDFVLPGALLERVTLVPGTRAHARGRRASGTVEMTLGQLDGTIRIGGLAFERPRVAFDDGMRWGNAGWSLLERARVTIDQANQRLELRPHGGGAAPRASRSGPRLERRGAAARRSLGVHLSLGGVEGVAVEQVVPGSTAERVGLQAGDVLERIDGRALSARDMQPLEAALSQRGPFRIELERAGETLVLDVPAEAAPEPAAASRPGELGSRGAGGAGGSESASSSPGPHELLARMEGRYSVQARVLGPDGARELEGRAVFQRLEDRPFLRESFVLEDGAEELAGEAYLAWRPDASRFELTQLDSFSPTTPWLTGAWDAARERLALRPVAGSLPGRPGLRWEYRFEPDGVLVKELLAPDGGGEGVLRSDYRYVPLD